MSQNKKNLLIITASFILAIYFIDLLLKYIANPVSNPVISFYPVSTVSPVRYLVISGLLISLGFAIWGYITGKSYFFIIAIILGILIIDQGLKITVKTTLKPSDQIHVFANWFIIRLIENKGMAFGIDIPGKYGKPALSLFRLLAILGIAYYLRKLILRKSPLGLIICISLILAGAAGNLIDSMFYGKLFSNSYLEPAVLFPEEGYESFLHGRVVDMLHFPIINGSYPSWVPKIGGQDFTFSARFSMLQTQQFLLVLSGYLYFKKDFLKKNIAN